ncbi:aspartyl protease family protein [Aquimarina sp. D1M17]|uniref:aspartyl protease family protein n=1 Tax=Aquimarina acroporae TaxID=2937283 RepID=UPI0020BF081C|nr:aspartyl protease family protein [Aquimarina acroporae]MCK8524248.1 aspartyl protease family protein [Aquimarina acroporae]
MKKFILIFVIVIIIGIVGIVYFFSNQYKKQDQLVIEAAPEYTSIPFKYSTSGHILIDAKIDDSQKKYSFILDTGASNHIFTNFPSEKIGSSIGRKISKDVNGKTTFPKIHSIANLEFGGIQLKKIAFSKANIKFPCSENIYGIIGKNIMHHFAWQFDFQNKVIHIAKEAKFLPNTNEESIKIKIETNIYSHHIYLPIQIGKSVKTDIVLDTGFNGPLILNPKIIDQLYEIKKIDILGEASKGIGGQSNSKQYLVNIDSLSIGKKHQLLLNTITAKTNKDSSFKAIGLGVLKNFLVTIDWKNKMLILSKQTNNQNFKLKGFGVNLGYTDEVYIKSVIKDSRSYHLGLRPNMKGFLVNGKLITNEEDLCLFENQLSHIDTLTLSFPKLKKDFLLSKEYYDY